MFILSLSCDAPEFLKAIVFIKILLVILQVMAPIILVIISSVDIIKAVTAGNQDEIMKNVHKIPKRLLSLAVVYLVPIIINMSVTLAQDVSEYSECYKKATNENVIIAYANKAESLVATAETDLTRNSLSDARGYLTRLDDKELIDALTKRLDIVEASIKAKEKEDYEEYLEKLKKKYPKNNPDIYPSSPGNSDNPLKMPYYSQCDSRWYCYQGYNSCRAACGYNSLAMIVAGLSKKSNITTLTIFKDYNLSGPGCNANGGFPTFEYPANSYANVNSVISKYGLKSDYVFGYGSGYSDSKKMDLIIAALKKGHAVEVNVPNHYIALAGIDSENKIYVLDPANQSKNGAYTRDQFIQTFKYYNGGSELRAAFQFYKG